MRPQGGRLSGAERRAVAESLSGRPIGGDHDRRKCRAAARCRRSGRLAAFPRGRGWSPAASNTQIPIGERRGLTATSVPHLTLKWSFGFPDATSAWSQPPRSQAGASLSAARTERCTRSTRRPGASRGRSRRRAACAMRRRSEPAKAAERYGVLRRHRRQRHRARRRHGPRTVAATTSTRIPSRESPDRRRSIGTGLLRAGVVDRVNSSQPAGYECVPGQRRGARHRHRRRRLAVLHRAAGGAGREERRRHRALGAFWRRYLVGANGRPEASRALHHYRQHLQRHDHGTDHPTDHRARTEDGAVKWSRQFFTAGDVFGCQRMPRTASRRPGRTTISAHRRSSRRPATAAISSSSDRSPASPMRSTPTSRAS